MPTKPSLDLTKIDIRPFSGETVVNQFCCGKRPIDRFIKNKAKKSDRRYETRTFCAHLEPSPICIGYYSLQIGSDSVDDLPDADRRTYLRTYTAFPAINLSFLGVHEDYQRQGLGEYLLMDVFSRVSEISKHAGFYALTLQSLDEAATCFYKSLGFAIYSENVNPPKMLYPLEDIITLVSQSEPASVPKAIAT